MIYKVILPLLCCSLAATAADIQCKSWESGNNVDPDPCAVSRRPYEIVGQQERHVPLATFTDCTQWQVCCENVNLSLHRSTDEVLYRDASGKVMIESPSAPWKAVIRAKKPIQLPPDWETLSMWVFGHRWMWSDPDVPPIDLAFLVRDAEGKDHRFLYHGYYKGSINYRDWCYLRVKVHEKLPGPCKLIGLELSATEKARTEFRPIFLGPIYAGPDIRKPLTFESWPKDLPFPVEGKSVLPTNLCSNYRNQVRREGDIAYFDYQGSDISLGYRVDLRSPSLDGISVLAGDRQFRPCSQGSIIVQDYENADWQYLSARADELAVKTRWRVTAGGITHSISYRFSIQQKSLVIEMEESPGPDGIVHEVRLGKAEGVDNPKLIRVPFYNYDYAEAPRILVTDDLFVSAQFDWTYGQSSRIHARGIDDEKQPSRFNGGVLYNAKTDGKRNAMRERLFITVSPEFAEVLPNIPNPPTPMGPLMAHRQWIVMNCNEYGTRWRIPNLFRTLGIEHVAVRYHEGTWRDLGGSFTFRTEAAPAQGGDEALRDLVSKVKGLGWLCGLYTNYTDIVTLNPDFNDDWMLIDEDGNWKPSWFRCYSIKPMVVVEQQPHLAPVIHEKFGTNHCYCDVHTAIPPWHRVDYDARVPGAGTYWQTWACYGRILLGERQAHKGPIFSEGGNHWWYAGLVDGNYANAFPNLLEQLPLVDFDLLKLHPLEMDAGSQPEPPSQRLAYTVAYGHIGQLIPHDDAGSMKIYYMLQHLQKEYVMVKVREITYHDGRDYLPTSEAIRRDALDKRRVRIIYNNGFTVWANLGQTPWSIKTHRESYSLPPLGFVALPATGSSISTSVLRPSRSGKDTWVDLAHGPYSHYIDTRGEYVDTPYLSGNGAAALKREAAGWELIPARSFEKIGFDPSLLGYGDFSVKAEAWGHDGLPKGVIPLAWRDGKWYLEYNNPAILKYRLTPEIDEIPEGM